jgi:uncharacterized protein YdhG (YjbR/CyaY superfamily)
MVKSKFESVDDYLAAQPEATRRALQRLRATIRKARPVAEEVISYQIPTYKLEGRAVIYFAGWKRHCSLYPVTEAVLSALGDALQEYEIEKGTLRIELTQSIPPKLVERLVKVRVKEVTAAALVKRQVKKKASPAARKVREKRATSRGKARSGA